MYEGASTGILGGEVVVEREGGGGVEAVGCGSKQGKEAGLRWRMEPGC